MDDLDANFHKVEAHFLDDVEHRLEYSDAANKKAVRAIAAEQIRRSRDLLLRTYWWRWGRANRN